MLIKDRNLAVRWDIEPTKIPYSHSDFDVVIKYPNKDVQYVESAIQQIDFIQPTSTEKGSVSYTLNLSEEGTWKVALTVGDSNNSSLYSEYVFRVSSPTEYVYKQIEI